MRCCRTVLSAVDGGFNAAVKLLLIPLLMMMHLEIGEGATKRKPFIKWLRLAKGDEAPVLPVLARRQVPREAGEGAPNVALLLRRA